MLTGLRSIIPKGWGYQETFGVWVYITEWIVLFLFVCLFFRATPMAYGGSQARGRFRAALLGYTTPTAMWDPSRVCDLHHSS